MLTAKLTSKGRITIPTQVREARGLRAGGWLSLRARGCGVFEMVVPRADLAELRGVVRSRVKDVSLKVMSRATQRHGGRR